MAGLCSFIGINKESAPQFYVLLGEEETSSDALYLLCLPYSHKQEERKSPRIPSTLSKTAIPGSIPTAAEVKSGNRSLLLPGDLFPSLPHNNHCYSLTSTTCSGFMGTVIMPISHWPQTHLVHTALTLNLPFPKLLPLITLPSVTPQSLSTKIIPYSTSLR